MPEHRLAKTRAAYLPEQDRRPYRPSEPDDSQFPSVTGEIDLSYLMVEQPPDGMSWIEMRLRRDAAARREKAE